GHLALEVQRLDEGHEVVDIGTHRITDEGRVPVSPVATGNVDIAPQRQLVEDGRGERGILELWIERIRRELGMRRSDALRERAQRPVLHEVALAEHVE